MQWMKKTGLICHGGSARNGLSISYIECLKGQIEYIRKESDQIVWVQETVISARVKKKM